MKVGHHFLERDEQGKPKIIPGLGEVLPAVYQELGFHWLPGFIRELKKRKLGIAHPESREWYAEIRINHWPESRPVGQLFIYPAVERCLVPVILLSAHGRLTLESLRRSIEQFLEKPRS